MVPQIEYIHPGREVMTLFDVEILDQREVPVLLHRSPKRMSGKVSVTSRHGVSVRNERSTTHEVRIEEVIQPAAHRPRGQDLLNRTDGAGHASGHGRNRL